MIPSDCVVEGDDNCNAKVNQRTVRLDSSGTKDEVSKEKTSCSLNSQDDQIAQSTDCNENPSNAMVSAKNKPHSLASANDGTLLQSQVLQKEQDEIPCGFDNLTSEGAASRNVSISECVDQLSGNPFLGKSTVSHIQLPNLNVFLASFFIGMTAIAVPCKYMPMTGQQMHIKAVLHSFVSFSIGFDMAKSVFQLLDYL